MGVCARARPTRRYDYVNAGRKAARSGLTLHADVGGFAVAGGGLPAAVHAARGLHTADRQDRLAALPRPVRHRLTVRPAVLCQRTQTRYDCQRGTQTRYDCQRDTDEVWLSADTDEVWTVSGTQTRYDCQRDTDEV